MRNGSKTSFSMHVALGTVSFTLCFAAWGLISAFAPQFRKIFELTPTLSAALVAAPVLLGSLARIPVGMLTDRLGGRLVFSALMAICAVPKRPAFPLAGPSTCRREFAPANRAGPAQPRARRSGWASVQRFSGTAAQRR